MIENLSKERNHAYYDAQYIDMKNRPHKFSYTKEIKDIDWYPAWKWIVDRISRGKIVLDVGCGWGHLCYMCDKKGVKTIGIDFSKVALREAKKISPNTELIHADVVKDISLIRNLKYDSVVFCEFLEHVKEDIYVLSNVPTGRDVLISVPVEDAESHVRFFSSLQDALDRYSKLINVINTEVITKYKFICIYGVRN